MARTLKDEQERIRRINLVGEYFLNNPHASTRNASQYFFNEKIEMSNCTISNYLKLYKELHAEKEEAIENRINENKPETHDNPEVQKRVLLVTKMYLEFDYTEEQIADMIHESIWVVRRDLSNRLLKLNKDLYAAYKEKARINSLNNIANINRK